jgi:hypothetical protein
MPEKPKVAFYWCASCGGCEEAVVDLAEDILKVVEAVDIVLWPVALDFKKDVSMPDNSIAVAFISGGADRAGGWPPAAQEPARVAPDPARNWAGFPASNFTTRPRSRQLVLDAPWSTIPAALSRWRRRARTTDLTLSEFFDTVARWTR